MRLLKSRHHSIREGYRNAQRSQKKGRQILLKNFTYTIKIREYRQKMYKNVPHFILTLQLWGFIG